MKFTRLKSKFADIISLVQTASSQDIMLINETAPAMVRFLCKDNIFRTFQLFEEEEGTKVETTSIRDSEETLQDFKTFVVERTKEEISNNKTVEAKAKAQAASKVKAKEDHKKAQAKKEAEGAAELQAEIALTKAVATPEKKVTKKKVTKKKPATKKKATKKKAAKKKKA